MFDYIYLQMAYKDSAYIIVIAVMQWPKCVILVLKLNLMLEVWASFQNAVQLCLWIFWSCICVFQAAFVMVNRTAMERYPQMRVIFKDVYRKQYGNPRYPKGQSETYFTNTYPKLASFQDNSYTGSQLMARSS